MFKIEELLELFQDNQEAKKIITTSYYNSQMQNKKLSDEVFSQFLYYKIMQPNLNIIVNYEQDTPSHFDSNTNTISLNGNFNETTFLHELTHLFSYNYSKFNVPVEYIDFQKKILSVESNKQMLGSFIQLCNNEIKKLFNVIESNENNEIKKLFNVIESNENNKIDKTFTDFKYAPNAYTLFCYMEDIIDAIYKGESSTYGLTYIKDNMSNQSKSLKSAGHGCDYYEHNVFDFEEILANYQAIQMLDPNNKQFILLKQILGDDFISFLNNRCNIINGNDSLTLDNSNNKKY